MVIYHGSLDEPYLPQSKMGSGGGREGEC